MAGVFTAARGTWQSAGLVLPPGSARISVQVLGLASIPGGNVALLLAAGPPARGLVGRDALDRVRISSGRHGARGRVRADGSAWVLPGGDGGEAIGGPGGSWQALPAVPPGTATLAPGPGGSYDALAVSGSGLTVWQLTRGAWVKVQLITVPIQYGSSG